MKINQKTFNNILIVGVALLIFLLTLLDKFTVKKYADSKVLMDTAVEMTVYGKDKKKLIDAVDSGFKEIQRIENLLSNYIEGSDVSNINSADGATVNVNEETVSIIEESIKIGNLTDGAFDITLGYLGDLWDFTSESPSVPDDAAIKKILQHTGNEKIVINKHSENKDATFSVRLSDSKAKIDLGGIAKGYAIKMAARALKRNGIKSGLIDAGGDIVVIGSKKGKYFKVGIKSPDDDSIIGIVNAHDVAIVTSGDYERCFIKDGVKYHHILDPKTGYPARGCRSVTVIAKDATVTDALSTAIFVLGHEKGIGIIDSLDDVEAMIVDDKNEVHLSKNALTFIEIRRDDENNQSR
jgi:thiamine biosynthesis lipoprotein